MSTKANVEDIKWSRQAYTLRQAIKRCTFPQIMKVVQGYESSDETETLSLNQILRINQIHTQTRILATTDKKGRWLSIPLRYAEARFEVVSGGKRSKPMYMREIIDKSLLPQKVNFFMGDDLTFNLQLKMNLNSGKEKFTSLTLHKMYETAYLQGNAIQNNHLDTMVLNIPLHSPVEVVLAEGFIVGSRDRWERYQTLLDKIVSKNVSFELHPGNPHITFFTDKKLESADSQEHYEQITPAGTLFVSTKNDRLRQSKGPGSVLPGPSGARTMSSVSAPRAITELSIDRDNASVQAGGDRHSRPALRHSQSDLMIGSSSTIDARPRMKSPGRALSPKKSVHATMPRSILKKKAKQQQEEQFPPPPMDMLGNNTMRNPMAYVPDNRPQSPPPQQGVRRRSAQSPGRLNRAKSPIRADFPRPVSQRPMTDGSPRGSSSSQNSSADSGYSTTSSTASQVRQLRANPFQGTLPEPDYDRENHFSTNGHDAPDMGSPRVGQYPPEPPPLSTIPSKQGAPVNGGGVVPGAPPPPPVGFIPPPPKYNDVPDIRAKQPQTKSPSKPPLVKENSRDDMLQELKLKAERRLSRMEGGIPNKPPVFGNRTSPRSPSSPRPLNNNDSSGNTELRALLDKRKSISQGEGTSPEINRKGPPAPAAKPSPKPINSSTPPTANKFGGARNSPRTANANFASLSEVPKDLGVLSVSQVCQCLKLMNLDKYESAFKKNSVDGQLMLQLNKDALKESFKLSDWDAQRVDSFIKGWRPKY